MSRTVQLPNALQAATQLKRLLRRDVEASVAPAPAKSPWAFGGAYRGQSGELLGYALADVAFAAYSAAAFALIPAEAAAEAARRGALDDNLRETFGEVLNVASRLFLAPEGARVTLREMHLPPQVEAPELLKAQRPLCLRTEIDGYGTGWFALALAG